MGNAVQGRDLTPGRHQLVTLEALAVEITPVVSNRVASLNKRGWVGLVGHINAVAGVRTSIARLAQPVNESDGRSRDLAGRLDDQFIGQRTAPVGTRFRRVNSPCSETLT